MVKRHWRHFDFISINLFEEKAKDIPSFTKLSLVWHKFRSIGHPVSLLTSTLNETQRKRFVDTNELKLIRLTGLIERETGHN